MLQVAIIADDLTGAADTGACFAQAGWRTVIALVPGPLPGADVLVLSTESRHLAQEGAVAQVRGATERLRAEAGSGWIYKKIDSTLRGHPAPELAAVLEALGLEQALVAPAFPAQGRATVRGQQLVDGMPLERAAFRSEVRSSDLLALFRDCVHDRPVQLLELSTVRRGLDAVCQALSAPGPVVVVADAETDADLATLAAAAASCQVRLLCGSAGLGRALVDALPVPPVTSTFPPLPQYTGPILVIAGSRHPRTVQQVEFAQQQGVVVLYPGGNFLSVASGAVDAVVAAVAAHLAGGQNVILTTVGLGDSPLGSQGVAARLAQVGRSVALECQLGGLVLTGGDIAAAMCAALEATTLWLQGEVRPGIAWGRLLEGLRPGLPVVTKAGSFGGDEALVGVIDHLLRCGKLGHTE